MFTNSLDFAKSINMSHYSMCLTIQKHVDLFESFGILEEKTNYYKKGTNGGRPGKYYILNENHKFFLVMLLKNSERIIKLKADTLLKFKGVSL